MIQVLQLRPLPLPPMAMPTRPRSAIPAAPVPVAASGMALSGIPARPLPAFPAFATAGGPQSSWFPATLPPRLGQLPVADAFSPAPERHEEPLPFAPVPEPAPAPRRRATGDSADYTDEDLRHALEPLIQRSDGPLEPMLRSVLRRALAELFPSDKPFRGPAGFDRLSWRLQALFSNRSFEEIAFEKTRRFHVEEIYLYDRGTLALISHASSDPTRHASPKRIEHTAQLVAAGLRDGTCGTLRARRVLADGQSVIACGGHRTLLAAIIRGEPNEQLADDLDFAQRRIEGRFREALSRDGTPLMREIQPFLEDCLLIQSPAPPV